LKHDTKLEKILSIDENKYRITRAASSIARHYFIRRFIRSRFELIYDMKKVEIRNAIERKTKNEEVDAKTFEGEIYLRFFGW
jgi:hypothetical protein